MEGRGDGYEPIPSNRQLLVRHADELQKVLETALSVKYGPEVSFLDSTSGAYSFERAFPRDDSIATEAAPTRDELNGFDLFGGVVEQYSNFTLSLFFDVVKSMPSEVREALRLDCGLTSLEHAVARHQGFQDDPNAPLLYGDVDIIDVYGGVLDGVSLSTIQIKDFETRKALHIVKRGGNVLFSYMTTDPVVGKLADDCIEVVGPDTELLNLIYGRANPKNIESTIQSVIKASNGMVDPVAMDALVKRVREAAWATHDKVLMVGTAADIEDVKFFTGIAKQLIS